jgi:hypothetical protein
VLREYGPLFEHRMNQRYEAIPAVKATDDDATIVWFLNRLCSLAVTPLFDRVVEWSTEAPDRAVQLDDPSSGAPAGAGYTAARAGDGVEIDRC